MAKILLYTDVHFSETSSIVNSLGAIYTTRLENLVRSVSWAEEQADINSCDQIICLGDFFDKPNLTSQELTALKDIKWSEKPHTFIVGNHESPHSSLIFNSVNALRNLGFKIISEPLIEEYNNYIFSFIPYTLEESRKNLKEYLLDTTKRKIVFSHNDIKGIQYGAFLSKEGFDIDDIDSSCDLFLNGHLHNGEKFCKKGINLGNLTGQNFTENAFKYSHGAFILDTDTLTLDFIENPYAFNFYKIEINKEIDTHIFDLLKANSVLSIKCNEKYTEKVKKILAANPNIIASRIIITREETDTETGEAVELNSTDYIQQFSKFIIDTLGKNEIVVSELSEILK